MSNIFISHASSNLQDAIGIKRHLLDLGFTVWMAAEDIQPGVNYAEEITKSISKADAVIVLLSPESIASPHVKREVNLTIDGQQIINFKDGTTTAMEISDVLNQKLKSSAVRKPQTERVGFLGKLTNLSTSGKALLALTMAAVIVAIVSFSGSPSSENTIASETQAPVDTTIVSKVIVAKESMMATDFSNELPGFPTAIVDYELTEVIKSADSWQLRLYGEDWQTPDYFEAGTQMNSCNDGFWVIRWRSESGSEIKSAGGYIDNQINVFTDETAQGGAGYSSNKPT